MSTSACPARALEDLLSHEWPEAPAAESGGVVKDAHGNTLTDDDTVNGKIEGATLAQKACFVEKGCARSSERRNIE